MPKLEEIVSKAPLFKQRVADFNISEQDDHQRLLRAYVAVVKDELVRRGGNDFGSEYEDGKHSLYQVYAQFLEQGRFPMEDGQIPIDATARFKKSIRQTWQRL